jgi:hypothetical protein
LPCGRRGLEETVRSHLRSQRDQRLITRETEGLVAVQLGFACQQRAPAAGLLDQHEIAALKEQRRMLDREPGVGEGRAEVRVAGNVQRDLLAARREAREKRDGAPARINPALRGVLRPLRNR